MEWIKTSNKLPPEGKYVLAKHNRGTWRDSDDQKNVNCVVVKMIKGITTEEREYMEDCARKITYKTGDVVFNNIVPYEWESFGPDKFFGQSIYKWCNIPD